VTVHDLPSLHRRYVDLAGRFKAAWTFHQFLQGIQKFFVEADVGRYPSDFKEIHTTLKSVADNLTGSGSELVSLQLDQVRRQLEQMVDILAAADSRVSPSVLRQFFDRVKNFDDQILAQMVKFYLLTAGDQGLSADRLDKVDYLLTKLGEEALPTGGLVPRDRTRLREIFEGFWGSVEGLVPEGAWLEERKAEMADIRRELGTVTDLERLNDSQLVQRYRESKQQLGRYMLHPELAIAVVETNLAFKNKVRQHYHLEEQRILAESQRIFELEGQVLVDTQLDQELTQFRRKFEEFERKQRTDNVKLEDLAYLRRQVEGLMPRLSRPAVRIDQSTAAGDQEAGPAIASAGAKPADSTLDGFVREILTGLEGTDNQAAPKAVALAREIYHLRLEPREVTAFRRLKVTPDGDPELETFLIEAAALRLRINQEAAEITELLDETAVTKDAPVFGRARQTTRVADTYVQRFGAFIDLAIQDSNFGEAQQLQLLRMRLIRDYSGLWLLVNRPST
jgi:hypothetical protein